MKVFKSEMVFKNNKPWVEIRPLAMGGPVTQATAEQSIPKYTQEAMNQIEEMLTDSNHAAYKDAKELFAALDL